MARGTEQKTGSEHKPVTQPRRVRFPSTGGGVSQAAQGTPEAVARAREASAMREPEDGARDGWSAGWPGEGGEGGGPQRKGAPR